MKKGSTLIETPPIPDVQPVDAPIPTNAEATKQSYENALLGTLTRIEKMLVAEQGRSPEFRVWEFVLGATDRHTIDFDIRPDKWIVWTRQPPIKTNTLRVALGADVPGLNAVEVTAGEVITLPGMSSQIAFHNPNTTNELRVFVVAVAVGDFNVHAASLGPITTQRYISTLTDARSNTDSFPIGSHNGVIVQLPLNYVFNDTTWDRLRNNTERTLLASAARTATLNSVDIINYNAKGIIVTLDVTAVTDTPSIVLKIQVKDALSGKYETILVATAVTATGTHSYIVYPGVGAAAEDIVEVIGYPLPRTYRIRVEHSDADSITYSVGGSEIL